MIAAAAMMAFDAAEQLRTLKWFATMGYQRLFHTGRRRRAVVVNTSAISHCELQRHKSWNGKTMRSPKSRAFLRLSLRNRGISREIYRKTVLRPLQSILGLSQSRRLISPILQTRIKFIFLFAKLYYYYKRLESVALLGMRKFISMSGSDRRWRCRLMLTLHASYV